MFSVRNMELLYNWIEIIEMEIATIEVEIHQSFTTCVNEKDNYVCIFTKTQLK